MKVNVKKNFDTNSSTRTGFQRSGTHVSVFKSQSTNASSVYSVGWMST